MMTEEFFYIVDHLQKEKNIPRQVIVEAIEAALTSAARKALQDKTESIVVKLDMDAKTVRVFKAEEEMKLPEFGRIAAQTAKQVMMQKIREAERNILFNDYTSRVGTITNGVVHRHERGNVIVDLGKAEAILPRNHMLPKEVFKIGDRVRAVIAEVKQSTKGPQIFLSRTNEQFVKILFELEVPEIYEDIVQIKAIARQPGERTKLAVWSSDEKIDSVGACVGMRGVRVKNIVKELKGEKIDIIRWDADVLKFISAALSPAEILELREDTQTGKIEVIVEENQLSLAIGKKGQNVRLASRLVNREIDIKSQTELLSTVKIPITEIQGIGQKVRDALIAAELDSVILLAKTPREKLLEIEGIGEKTADKIISGAKKVLEERGIKLEEQEMPRDFTSTIHMPEDITLPSEDSQTESPEEETKE